MRYSGVDGSSMVSPSANIEGGNIQKSASISDKKRSPSDPINQD
eukprot:CAMPEP_0116875722 /NCGR_PEP_ID=MMETSP0463-20121206/7783_1 /TAXON_ID=181622 /ORGANISM="Strombidinopsis sp, Strain SopsisLIS2011" /LENGTH=43 /DNA_ID= /DNA_START= /DNA_END= /DNA_ORIENTATION=